MSISPLVDTYSVVGESLAGCSCPGLDNDMTRDANFLKDNGVVAVVSLNEAELDWPSLVSVGVAHLRVHVRDYRPPTIEQLKEIRAFWRNHRQRGIVAVHCNAGMGRTGTVLACLMMCETGGLGAIQAISKIRELRRGSVQTFKQEDGVKAWEAFLSTEQHLRP